MEVGNTYKITDLTVRKFGMTTLMTTFNTTILGVEDLVEPNYEPVDQPRAPEEIEVREITQAVVTRMTQCGACRRVLHAATTGKFVRCNKCQMKQKVANLSRRYSATVNVVTISGVTKFTIGNHVLTNFMENRGVPPTDTDTVREFLLKAEQLCFQTLDGKIINII